MTRGKVKRRYLQQLSGRRTSAAVLSLHYASLDDLGHNEKSVAHRGRTRLEKLALIGFGNFVCTQPLHAVERMGHGIDVRGVGLIHAINQREDIAEFGDIARKFVIRHLEPGQMSDFLNFFPVQTQSFEGSLESGLNYLK